MIDKLTFERENRERIQAVETSFGPSGKNLYQPSRVLMGEGRLIKQGRRMQQQKVFFLFNDVLVYGSIILDGRWHKNQKIIPLENILLEDMEDMTHQWLMRTPRKSFFVSACSCEEKQSWMAHIEECRAKLLQANSLQPGATFAVSWIPDKSSYKCMRCLKNFTVTRRRHHCRKCGFLVCSSCSKHREVMEHIHPTKKLRVCSLCHRRGEEEMSHLIRDESAENNSSEDNDLTPPSDEDGPEVKIETTQSADSSKWLDCRRGTWGQMNYVNSRQKHKQRPKSSII